MRNQCYAVYSLLDLIPSKKINCVYRFTADKKTAKRLAKQLKKHSGIKTGFVELNPTDWGVLFFRPEFGDLPLIIACGSRYQHEAEQTAEILRQTTNLAVSVQKFDETIIFEMSQKEGLLSEGVFYA